MLLWMVQETFRLIAYLGLILNGVESFQKGTRKGVLEVITHIKETPLAKTKKEVKSSTWWRLKKAKKGWSSGREVTLVIHRLGIAYGTIHNSYVLLLLERNNICMQSIELFTVDILYVCAINYVMIFFLFWKLPHSWENVNDHMHMPG